MSYLEKQSSLFKGSLASAASKISNPSTVKASSAAATLAPPSPSPSAASDTNTPTAKRKRDVPTGETWSQPQLTGYGSEVKTQMAFAVEHLKKKGEPKAVNDILGFLSLTNHPDDHKRELIESLRGHPRVDWRPDPSLSEQTWRTGTYEHRPIIPGVKSATTLLAHLQKKTDASGVSVRDLKDGWPDCEDTLATLESAHKVLVVRTKKDNFPRFVWPDDPSLHYKVEVEFQSMWHRVPIPSLDDMHRKLTGAGLKPTSDDPHKASLGQAGKKQQKKRAGKRIGKATNVHMQHLMQDYSGMRR